MAFVSPSQQIPELVGQLLSRASERGGEASHADTEALCDGGADAHGDTFEITCEGGAEDTQLTRLSLRTDQNLAGLSDDEIAANRNGSSTDDRAAAAVRFAIKIAETRGQVSDADVAAIRLAGYSDAEVIEIVLHVALNTLTNYVNEVADTTIDFPAVKARNAA